MVVGELGLGPGFLASILLGEVEGGEGPHRSVLLNGLVIDGVDVEVDDALAACGVDVDLLDDDAVVVMDLAADDVAWFSAAAALFIAA